MSQTILAETIQCPKSSDFAPTELMPSKLSYTPSTPHYYLLLRDQLKNNWDFDRNTTKLWSYLTTQDELKNGMPGDTPLTIALYSPGVSQQWNTEYCLYESPNWTIAVISKQSIDNWNELINKAQWSNQEIFTAAEHRDVGNEYLCHTTAAHPETCYQ